MCSSDLSNDALALATRMETRLPWRPTRGSLTSPSYLVRIYVNLERIVTSYIGTPYVWGGSTELTGFDCSGLVQWSCNKALGIELPRTTYVQQYVGESVPLDLDELRMGDLLFFYTPGEGTHQVAMYLADGYYVHAPCSGDVVKITSMDEFAPTFARRVIAFADIDRD